MSTSPLDNRPHVLVVYAEVDPDDNGRWVRTVAGPYPDMETAKKEGQRAAYLTGADYDVLNLQPPFDQTVVQPVDSAPFLHLTKGDADKVAAVAEWALANAGEDSPIHNYSRELLTIAKF